MKAAKEVGHRRQPVRWRRSCCAGERPLCRGHPATLPPQSRRAATASDPADSGGAEARAPIRRRRAHSHRPGLCSDKWGASCPDVWSRGRRASPRQRGSCLGRRRSDVVPGPTKPVQPLSPPRRGASSRTCHRPQRPRNPPLQGRAQATPGLRRGKEAPMPAGGRRPALLEIMQRAPTRSNPPPRLSAEDTPWANRPSKGPRRQSIKGEPSNSLGKGAPARKQLLFYPPASFKRRQKTQSNLTKGGLIKQHFC